MMVIGIGNEFRHDDAAGLIAVRQLRELGVTAEEHEGDLATLIGLWEGAGDLILIDAVSSGAVPGTLHRLDVSSVPLPPEVFRSSTHALGLADAVELSRTLGTLPPRVLVFGVEAQDFTAGTGLTPEVERAVSVLVEEVVLCTKHR
jgi:hydrogenase maturation protease